MNSIEGTLAGVLGPWLRLLLLAVATSLGGCANEMGSTLDVPVDLPIAASREISTPPRTQVKVTDIRRQAHLERTTVGGLSMGRIVLKPPEVELVQAVIETKGNEVLAGVAATALSQTVLCGIRLFEITTPATLLYWDINVRIELVLRVRGQDRTVSGAATERTYLWPTKEIIGRVTTTALRQVSVESGRALEELLLDSR